MAKKKVPQPVVPREDPVTARLKKKRQREKKCSQIAKLCDEAIVTLAAGQIMQTRNFLSAIRGIAMSAEIDEL